MKKIISCVLLILMLLCLTAPVFAAYSLTAIDVAVDSPYYPDMAFSVSAKYVLILDNKTGTVLYNKGDINDRIYPASTTKILTALMVVNHYGDIADNLNDTVSVSYRATNLGDGSSVCGLKTNDKVTVLNLLYGLMLPSGNDAAIALAEAVSGSISGFAGDMNDYAAELGATGTHFVNPHGLNNTEHYTTLHDMALFAHAFTQNETLNKIVKTKTYDMTLTRNQRTVTFTISNTNELLDPEKDTYNQYITGLKTGSTTAAGACLVARYQKDDIDLLILSYNGDTEDRFSDANQLAEFAATGFTSINLADVFTGRDFVIPVNNASKTDEGGGMLATRFVTVRDYTLVTSTKLSQAIKNAGEENDAVRVVKPESIDAPVYPGDIVGKVVIYLNDEILVEGDVVATREVLQHIDLPDNLYRLAIENTVIDDKPFTQTASFWVLIALTPFVLASIYILLRLLHGRIHANKAARHNQVYTRQSNDNGGFNNLR